MSAPLISRFDLVFVMQDTANRQSDRSIASHIFGYSHTERANSEIDSSAVVSTLASRLNRLTDRIRLQSKALLTTDELRSLIRYCRLHVHPKMTVAGAQKLQLHYMSMRARAGSAADTTPITPRYLASLIRVAVARARIELSDEVLAS